MPYAPDLYKTKMCSLYMQRGYCPRQSCSFAHGESELRKLPGNHINNNRSFSCGNISVVTFQHLWFTTLLSTLRINGDALAPWAWTIRQEEAVLCTIPKFSPVFHRADGRYDSGGSDLRRSPTYWRRSPPREEREHNWPHDHRSPQHDRGQTQSKSPAKRRQSDSLSPQRSPEYKRKDSKKHPDSTEPHLSDVSGPIDGAEDVADKDNDKDRSRSISTSSEDTVEEQLQEVYSSNETLLDQKAKLEHSLQTKVLKTTELSEKIAQLETQLASTHNVCKGLASRTKKFVKAYKGFFRAQEELKKSQTKLMKLVDDMSGDDGPKLDMDMEFLDTAIISNEEPMHELPTNNQTNHRLLVEGSHTMPRQENTDIKTSNHLPSTVEQPKLVENSKQRKLTTAQERRRALLQKALQQGGLFVEQS
ncbi:unnamed protein product [Sphagnum tenellum]